MVAEQMCSSTNNNNNNSDKSSPQQRRRSSFFAMAIRSFARTGGSRGATVDHLRGTNGATFEGKGKIVRCCSTSTMYGCLFGGRRGGGKTEQYLLVKGPYCFVFASQEALSPLYAIGFKDLQAKNVPSSTPNGRATVLLESSLGDAEYEISFVNLDMAQQFQKAISVEGKAAETMEVRVRLGHDHLVPPRRASVVYAEQIARDKQSKQPEAPLAAHEILASMPVSATL